MVPGIRGVPLRDFPHPIGEGLSPPKGNPKIFDDVADPHPQIEDGCGQAPHEESLEQGMDRAMNGVVGEKYHQRERPKPRDQVNVPQMQASQASQAEVGGNKQGIAVFEIPSRDRQRRGVPRRRAAGPPLDKHQRA